MMLTCSFEHAELAKTVFPIAGCPDENRIGTSNFRHTSQKGISPATNCCSLCWGLGGLHELETLFCVFIPPGLGATSGKVFWK